MSTTVLPLTVLAVMWLCAGAHHPPTSVVAVSILDNWLVSCSVLAPNVPSATSPSTISK
jgi:hypothetical protein